MKKVIYRPRALLDLKETASYLSIEGNAEVADRFLDAVQESAKTLVGMPGIGALCAFHNPRLRSTRRIPITGFENWIMFYQVTEKHIDVIRVLHGARDIAAIFEQGA
jgi:toxin ParE1/3/4